MNFTPAPQSRSKFEWGDEVLPGVYMIRRQGASEILLRGSTTTLTATDVEQIYASITESAALIQRLQESNTFIREYLDEGGVHDVSDGDEGSFMGSISTDPAVAVRQREDKDACFGGTSAHDPEMREALRENEEIIATKEKEVAALTALVAGFGRCASEAVSARLPTDSDPSAPDQRIALPSDELREMAL